MSMVSEDSNSVSSHTNVSGAGSEYITAYIGNQLFGLPVAKVHDVFMPHSITRIPLAAPEVAGVLNMRGRIVTAIDMRKRLGMEPRDKDAVFMAIGVERKGESFGLIIDSVGEVILLPDDNLERNPCNLDPCWREVSFGVQQLEKNLLIMIDIEKVLSTVGQSKVA